MVNKKYLLLAGLCSVMAAQPLFAQESQPNSTTSGAQWSSRDMTYRGKGYDVLDSSYIPKSRMGQHRKFLNHQYAFPAKPRSMWEVGFGLGMFNAMTDVPTQTVFQKQDGSKGGYGLNVNVRKSWGYVFSTRLQFNYGIAKGLDWQPTNSYGAPYSNFNAAAGYANPYGGYSSALPTSSNAQIFRSYRMEASQLNLDFMFNLANINFHRARNSVSFYAFGGVGALAYKTRVDALDSRAGYTTYGDYNTPGTIFGGAPANHGYGNKKATQNYLAGAMDGNFETDAATKKGATIGNKTLDFAPSVGAGVQFKLSKRINLQLEDRYTFVGDDYLDGTPYGSPLGNKPSYGKSNDAINYLSLGINFNIGNKKKSVEPLYWMNPLDNVMNELSYPRHMVLPDPVLPDADGDGITDQFDKCPNTPAGVAVDAHGCPMDTDGDGVPDYKDKQLITPTECQPVDADGVGKCPCPDGCGAKVAAGDCSTNISMGTLVFTGSHSKISAAMQAQLAVLAGQMMNSPTCHVVIIGAGNKSKVEQQRSWEHVNAIIEYLSEKHSISRDRFIFQYGQDGDSNTVMYRGAKGGEEGPQNVPPPFPNLKNK